MGTWCPRHSWPWRKLFGLQVRDVREELVQDAISAQDENACVAWLGVKQICDIDGGLTTSQIHSGDAAAAVEKPVGRGKCGDGRGKKYIAGRAKWGLRTGVEVIPRAKVGNSLLKSVRLKELDHVQVGSNFVYKGLNSLLHR